MNCLEDVIISISWRGGRDLRDSYNLLRASVVRLADNPIWGRIYLQLVLLLPCDAASGGAEMIDIYCYLIQVEVAVIESLFSLGSS